MRSRLVRSWTDLRLSQSLRCLSFTLRFRNEPCILVSLLKAGASVHVARGPIRARIGFHFPNVEAPYRTLKEMTPLHLAAYHRRFKNVRTLVLHGADFTEECDFQKSRHEWWGRHGESTSEDLRVPRGAVEAGLRDAYEHAKVR